jgi:hypothetical protein
MRWVVEVSSIGKTDLQKFCVEAESWQRALQAARAERGEEGPMSGFSIELLEEGYRAVDPIARVRFVVKRAPDDAPITAPPAKEAEAGVAPTSPSTAAPSDATVPKATAASSSSSAVSSPTTETQTSTARTADKSTNGPAAKPAEGAAAPSKASATPAVPAGPLASVGSALPGLPAIKLLSSREQNPTEASPLTYREYSFAVPPGTSEDVAVAVLRGQLKLVDAHLADTKMGKLVNLAVFDVEFTGRPPSPPIATLTWKDWKGDPVIAYPRRGAADKQGTPQSSPPNGSPSVAPAGAIFPPPSMPPPAHLAVATAPAPAVVAPAVQSASPEGPAAVPPSPSTSPMLAQAQQPPPMVSPSRPPPDAGGIPVAIVAPAAVVQPTPQGSIPPPAQALVASVSPPAAAGGSVPPAVAQSPSQPPARSPSLADAQTDGLIRTPSGRFVRGRTTGDELITALFESMHDLHFLRDALDGGQFCLALATEVLPARAALIHFFDIEKREWVIACTRGKDTTRLLTQRAPESDEQLREAARKRRAMVTSDASTAKAQRYQTLGGSKSIIIAPIMQAGRALGAIEIINPLDGMPFTEDEGNAMTYIAEQYAEYLGSRGIVLDRDRIQRAAAPR